jgi:pepF/M3 family oligoendopeptidase
MTTAPLPHWDLSQIYTGLDAPAFAADFDATMAALDALLVRFNTLGIDQRAPSPLSDADIVAFEELIGTLGQLDEQILTLRSFIYSFVATDTRNQVAQARYSEFQQRSVTISQIENRFTAWLSGLDIEDLVERSALAATHEHLLQRARMRAAHLMSPIEENLAAELGPTGGKSWSRLQADVSSQLLVPVQFDGQSSELPMTLIRNIAFENDRTRRRVAYEAELAAWKRAEVPIAAAMNGIKGEVGMLARRRNWATPLDQALFDNAIDQTTINAMLQAARESFPDFRRYLQAKARVLGIEQLAWYDLFAPVAGETEGKIWSFDNAREFILTQFATFTPEMAALAQRAFDEGWIDAEPRAGKVGGAFCMPLRAGESRILANHSDSIGSVMTLAHELGHAYHNHCLATQSPRNRSTPMTLAETASIFCETIVRKAALAEAAPQERLVMLESALQNTCQVVVDITSRFLFEQAIFEQRRQRALSAEELCAAMLAAQRETYGDGLDPQFLHGYMWAAKPHYYSASLSFYNFPYMFGLLFGLGLYAIYTREPQGFVARYNALLAATGRADAATLAAQVGIDIRTPDFWRASLDMIREDIDAFVALVP